MVDFSVIIILYCKFPCFHRFSVFQDCTPTHVLPSRLLLALYSSQAALGLFYSSKVYSKSQKELFTCCEAFFGASPDVYPLTACFCTYAWDLTLFCIRGVAYLLRSWNLWFYHLDSHWFQWSIFSPLWQYISHVFSLCCMGLRMLGLHWHFYAFCWMLLSKVACSAFSLYVLSLRPFLG